MNFVSSMPSNRIGLEHSIQQILGVDVQIELLIATAAFAAVTLIFKSSLINSGLR